ncbi:MAG: mannitol-1-phosphate 5-dehydrogenase [Firmicutes bacterium]|nr:mannitol-1-phosphate 5-dehydrogenase [Bacillota bacterium]
MTAVHFGAGNIGRGFIGMILSQSGYTVHFVTRNPKKIALLQQRNQYNVTLASAAAETIPVQNVTATSIEDIDRVAQVIATTDLITTAVGTPALKSIAKAIAQGLIRRLQKDPRPLNIIACENAIGGSTQLKKWVYTYLPMPLQVLADRYIAFPNTVVDRIVPAQRPKNLLDVTVEPFYEWVIDRSAMQEAPLIHGVKYVDSLTPYIERKLFTVNTGHCSSAYYGYLHGYATIQEALKDPQINQKVQSVLQETGALLIEKYHFNAAQHQQYILKILRRFSNPHLKDKVTRVARCPLRKLSMNERLVRPTLQAYDRGLEVSHLTSVMAAALLFNYEKDPQVAKLHEAIQKQGLDDVIARFMGIPQDHPVHQAVVKKYHRLNAIYNDVYV